MALDKIQKQMLEENVQTELDKIPVLNEKQTELDAQLAQKASQTEVMVKADKSYVDTQVQAVASGSPKGIYATLSALQTAFPTGNSNIYLVTADGKWYYWNGSVWTAGGTYQSTGIADNAIVQEKINDSLKDSIYQTQSIELWDFGMFNPNGTTYDSTARLYTPAYISVKKGDIISLSDYTSHQLMVAEYSDKNTSSHIRNTGWITSGLYTAPQECYVRVVVGTKDSSVITIDKGDKCIVRTSQILKGSIDTEKLSTDLQSFFYGSHSWFWELGMIDTSLGSNMDSTTRIRTVNFESVKKDTIFKLSDYTNHQIAFFLYNLNDYSFITFNGWITGGEYIVPQDCFLKIAIGTKDNSTIQSTEVANVSRLLTSKAYLKEIIKSEMIAKGSITSDKLSTNLTTSSKWKNKKVNFLGDSITAGSEWIGGTFTTVDKPYHQHLKELLELSVARNYGIASTAISTKSDYATHTNAFINRYANMDNDADMVVVFGGTNDFGHNTPLGTINDKTDVSFYGALNVLINGLINKYSGKRIIFMTPLHRNSTGDNNETNSIGIKLSQYVQAIKDVCGFYSVPVVDTYNISGITPFVQTIYDTYITDGLHPNEAGHALLANNIYGQFETL